MKKKIKQHFATTYRRLTKKIMAFVYRSTFLVYFTILAPSYTMLYLSTIDSIFCTIKVVNLL